jgi:hypothetical protein
MFKKIVDNPKIQSTDCARQISLYEQIVPHKGIFIITLKPENISDIFRTRCVANESNGPTYFTTVCKSCQDTRMHFEFVTCAFLYLDFGAFCLYRAQKIATRALNLN